MKYAINCARMVDASGRVLERQTILTDGGRIEAVGEHIGPGSEYERVDAEGLTVTPGLIEAHCHAAADLDDLNEATGPVSVCTRARDAIDPFSKDIPFVRRAGFTTLCVLPGSANLIGGTGVVIKLKQAQTASEMSVYGREPFKMALGENPRRTYGSRGVLPSTRMGNIMLIRRTFEKAKAYLDKKRAGKLDAEDSEMEVLCSVLTGERRVRIHCHAALDIVSAVEFAEGLGLDFVLEHVSQGEKIAGWLGSRGVRCCAGPVLLQPIKHELEKPIVPTLPAALERSGVEFALMSDENMAIVYLPMYVGCCVPFGMSWETGIKALTINAARILQIDGRTGSIEPGKDADLAFFNGDPLANTTRCLGTMIDGVFYDRAF